jgi:hypothetical protein
VTFDEAKPLLDAAQDAYRSLPARPTSVRVGPALFVAIQRSYDFLAAEPGPNQPYRFKGVPVTLDTDLPTTEARWQGMGGEQLQ